MYPSSEMTKPVPPCCSLCSSSSPWPSPRRCCGPKKNSKGSPFPLPPPKGETNRRDDPLTISVEVIETTENIVSSAMSATEGRINEPERARAGASRCASERGVTLTELATTIPKMTAAAMRTENERARLVDFSMVSLLLLRPLPSGTVVVHRFKLQIQCFEAHRPGSGNPGQGFNVADALRNSSGGFPGSRALPVCNDPS